MNPENFVSITDHQILEKYYRFDIRDRFKKSETFTLKEISNFIREIK
jgi:DMSO/TMAO reductase YedYZ molybdopterin-dependent catalytic subunit